VNTVLPASDLPPLNSFLLYVKYVYSIVLYCNKCIRDDMKSRHSPKPKLY